MSLLDDLRGGLYRGHGEDYYSTRDHCLFSRLSACGLHSTMTDLEEIRRRIAELQLEHRGLDAMIEAIALQTRFDELQLRRLKKRKLQIKDSITLLQMQLVPDQPA
jgi:hypothetical protein